MILGIIKNWHSVGDQVIEHFSEEYIATEGQTVFVLTNGTYSLGKNMVKVQLNGLWQPSSFITEIDENTVELKVGVSAGTKVNFEYTKVSSETEVIERNVRDASMESVQVDLLTLTMVSANKNSRGTIGTNIYMENFTDIDELEILEGFYDSNMNRIFVP